MKYLPFILGLLLSALPASAETPEPKATIETKETVITSDLFEMVGGETENYFYFKGNVIVIGTNLYATCDSMEVVADRTQSEADEKAVGKVGTIQSIVMTGNVDIEQAGRRAEAGRADILPREDKVILSDNPKVIDNEGVVSGCKITLFKGERRALVEGCDDEKGSGKRPTIQLPGFQNLGFEDKQETTQEEAAPASNPTGDFINRGSKK